MTAATHESFLTKAALVAFLVLVAAAPGCSSTSDTATATPAGGGGAGHDPEGPAPDQDAGAAPASLTLQQIRTWLADKLDGTHAEYPTNVDDAIYVLFYPQGTTIDEEGKKSCSGFHGFHYETNVGKDAVYPFAVIARCPSI